MIAADIVRLAPCGFGKKLTALQVVQTANQKRTTLLINRAFDSRHVKRDACLFEPEVYPSWTGTAIATRKAGEKLGAAIEYESAGITYVFEVPVHLQGEKDIALAVEHGFTSEGNPIFAFREDGKNRFVLEVSDTNAIGIVEAFPTRDGWHLTDAKFGIPTSDNMGRTNPNARYLSRTGDYVGLVARGYIDELGDFGRLVFTSPPDYHYLGVLGTSEPQLYLARAAKE